MALEVTLVTLIGAISVSDRPEFEMTKWSIREFPLSDTKSAMHLCGNVDGTGRVSSEIIELDIAGRVGRTQSGRLYRLVGEPGSLEEAGVDCIWKIWADMYEVVGDKDITQEIIGGS